MTVPLQRLGESVRLMQRGEKWSPVEVQGKDDIADLTRSFNKMGAEIDAQMAKLQRESQVKQQLVDDLAHEMRTPLTAIYGYAEYLQKAPYTEEELYDALEYIMSESKRLTHMGQELLTMAIYREDELNAEIISTEDLYKDISNMLESTLHEKRLKLVKKEKEVSLERDRAMLVCLLRNLIENAARASESGSRIWVVMKKAIESLMIQVKDEGIGMEPHVLDRITDAFYRVDKARSRETGGTGLGLSIAHSAVEFHNGTIEVESTLGPGSAFKIILPLVDWL
jgi:signal transduction histidine kinase